MRMVVDFPAPLGPRKPTTWPRSTANETWSTAVTPPNRLETPSTERKGIPASECVYRRCDANHTPGPSSRPPLPQGPLQRLEERHHRGPICCREPLEPVARSGAFPAMQLDRLLEAAGPSVVEEGLGVTQVE